MGCRPMCLGWYAAALFWFISIIVEAMMAAVSFFICESVLFLKVIYKVTLFHAVLLPLTS